VQSLGRGRVPTWKDKIKTLQKIAKRSQGTGGRKGSPKLSSFNSLKCDNRFLLRQSGSEGQHKREERRYGGKSNSIGVHCGGGGVNTST